MNEYTKFIFEHWKELGGMGTAALALLAVGFNVVDRYKKIPQMSERIVKLEERKTCLFHDNCAKSIEEDITAINATLRDMEDKREEGKDKLYTELKCINKELGKIKGHLNVS